MHVQIAQGYTELSSAPLDPLDYASWLEDRVV